MACLTLRMEHATFAIRPRVSALLVLPYRPEDRGPRGDLRVRQATFERINHEQQHVARR